MSNILKHNRRISSPDAAFSLTELLVAIAVVAALIALAFPAVQKIAESSAAAKCASNLRVLAGAAASFSNDNQGNLPNQSYNRQADGLCKYLDLGINYVGKTVMTCPALNKTYPPAVDAYHHRTYSINLVSTFDYKKGVKNRSKVASPSTMVIFLDGFWNDSASRPGANQFHFGGINDPTQFYKLTHPHLGRSQVVFLDGHVEALDKDQLEVEGATGNIWYGR